MCMSTCRSNHYYSPSLPEPRGGAAGVAEEECLGWGGLVRGQSWGGWVVVAGLLRGGRGVSWLGVAVGESGLEDEELERAGQAVEARPGGEGLGTGGGRAVRWWCGGGRGDRCGGDGDSEDLGRGGARHEGGGGRGLEVGGRRGRRRWEGEGGGTVAGSRGPLAGEGAKPGTAWYSSSGPRDGSSGEVAPTRSSRRRHAEGDWPEAVFRKLRAGE